MDRREFLALSLAGGTLPLVACGGGSSSAGSTPVPASRAWRMGFSSTPVKPDTATLLQGVDLWSQRAELALIHENPPWAALLAGQTPQAYLSANRLPLVQYFRSKGLKLVYTHDLTNGLDRSAEAPELVAAGRSLSDPQIQQMLVAYVSAVATMLAPDYTGLAAETNLIRAMAPASLYTAVVQSSNACASALRAAAYAAPLFVSVQVEAAWGWAGSTTGSFVGIAQDQTDFPFVTLWGLSSYPYFIYSDPALIPANYYSRVLANTSSPAFVSEGGWTSASVGNFVSSPAAQANYLTVQASLLQSIRAQGVLQLIYADLDLASYPQPQPANLPLFAQLGVVDSGFQAKPALAVWDGLFARPLVA